LARRCCGYTFTVRSDDGIRLWLDNTLLIDEWKDQGAITYTATANVSAGDHLVKAEYYDHCCIAIGRISWQLNTQNQPPVPTITSPAATLTFKVGDTISFSGAATDPEDLTIPTTGLAWPGR
jgi:hypothetical protein